MPAGVTISPNMTMATVMTHIRARNTVKVLQEGKDGHAGEKYWYLCVIVLHFI